MAEQNFKKNLTPNEMLTVIFDKIGEIANERLLHNALIMMADMAREILVADRCTVWLLDKEKDQLFLEFLKIQFLYSTFCLIFTGLKATACWN